MNDVISQMQALLQAIMDAPKGSQERRLAEYQFAKYLQSLHQDGRDGGEREARQQRARG